MAMIREERFLISRRPYAVDLTSLHAEQTERDGTYFLKGRASAVWYRRQGGVTRACLGTLGLWKHYLSHPVDVDDPEAVLRADLDGRYGGDCEGRWDGESYWGNGTLDEQNRHLAILRPMLANYPRLPAGYDGWWRF